MTALVFRWPTPRGRPPLGLLAGLLAILALLAATSGVVDIRLTRLAGLFTTLPSFLTAFIVMPDWTYLPELGRKLLQTAQITLLATSLALIVSLPLGLLAATNASPHPLICRAVRAVLALTRALPDLVWALVFVSALGLGVLPGVMALSVVTVGFMAKFFAESIEVVDTRPVEGVSACGANWLQLRVFAMLPQAVPDLIGSTLYILDHNLRAATILGLVGAGGIGYDMIVALRLFQFERLGMIVVAIYLAVTALDRLSLHLRRKVI